MLRYQLIPPSTTTLPAPKTIRLPDNAYGADLYLRWRRRGFELRRIPEASEIEG